MTRPQVAKTLSPNDLGLTGSHQAGMFVPRRGEILEFLPTLDSGVKNPRRSLIVREENSGEVWEFAFIYYNGKKFGGTRDEYRITRMTRYLAAVNAAVGDELVFTKDGDGSYVMSLRRQEQSTGEELPGLVLTGGWKIISV
jgi:hypothetical protein